jgi:hypothetical protein
VSVTTPPGTGDPAHEAGAAPGPGGGGPAGTAAGARTSTSPTAAALWRAGRGPLAVGLVLVLLGLLLAVAASTREEGDLDPRSVGPAGTRALATLLRDEGVRVDLVRTSQQARAAATAGSTLVVAEPGLLDAPQRRALGEVEADVVLLAPGDEALRTFLPEVASDGTVPVETRTPTCAYEPARAAGPASTGGRLFSARGSEDGRALDLCYAAGGRASLVHATGDDGDVTALGTSEPLTNDALAEEGNAALAMRALGGNPRVVWYLPSPADTLGGGTQSPTDLLPGWVRPAAWQLALAVVLTALWRARRLGPVVVERLPVVVRATESTEGRARLYRRARARDRAADALRAAARDRLPPLLGLPPTAGPETLVPAVAGRTGRDPSEVGALLYGAAPGDDAALLRLAHALDTLEGEVRTP